MYTRDGITYASPFEPFNFPDRDLSGIPDAGHRQFKYLCPECGEELDMSEDEYEIDGVVYPEYCNESLGGTMDGTYHDWEEVYKCKKCGTLCKLSNGCF